jgi:hypothetical protein
MRVYVYNVNTFQNGSPWIRLMDSNGNYYQYQYYVNNSPYDLLNEARNQWRSYDIPIDPPVQPTGWRRTSFGTPDIAHINRLEFHADTWDYGFKYWLDGVYFVFNGGAPVTSIGAAKTAADNTRVDLTGAAVSAAWTDVFYIETTDRRYGIRVEKPGHGLTPGQTARIFGYVKTNADGERTIDASWAMADGGAATIKPLLMTNKALGGSDMAAPNGQKGVVGGTGLNNIGLLVRAAGKVVERDPAPTPAWFKINDGSNVMLKVIVPAGGSAPGLNTFAAVTGVSSCYKSAGLLYRQLLMK